MDTIIEEEVKAAPAAQALITSLEKDVARLTGERDKARERTSDLAMKVASLSTALVRKGEECIQAKLDLQVYRENDPSLMDPADIKVGGTDD